MKKEDKSAIIEQLQSTLSEYAHFYLTDIGGLDAALTSDLRRLCFKQDVRLVVAKNTLLRKALDNLGQDYSGLYDSLKGETAVMLSNTGNAPAKLIKEFVSTTKNPDAKPILKAAYVEETIFVGASQLDVLALRGCFPTGCPRKPEKQERTSWRTCRIVAIAGQECYIRTPVRRKYYPWRVENVRRKSVTCRVTTNKLSSKINSIKIKENGRFESFC